MEKRNLVQRFIALVKNKNVPVLYKLIPLVGVVYLVWPFDAISDLLPVLGQLDDAALLTGAVALFLNIAEKKAEGETAQTIPGKAAEFRNGVETEIGLRDEEETD